MHSYTLLGEMDLQPGSRVLVLTRAGTRIGPATVKGVERIKGTASRLLLATDAEPWAPWHLTAEEIAGVQLLPPG